MFWMRITETTVKIALLEMYNKMENGQTLYVASWRTIKILFHSQNAIGLSENSI